MPWPSVQHELDFDQFLSSEKLTNKDDETKTLALIKRLVEEINPRVLLENFPQNQFQANFFIKNCVRPSAVFYLNCSKDAGQERMIELGKDHKDYVPSALLSKKIHAFHKEAPSLMPFLQKQTNFFEVSSEGSFTTVFKRLYSHIEPQIIHIRSGNNNELRKEMVVKLVEEHGFVNLEVNSLIRDETERKTNIGQEFLNLVSAGKIIPADMIVKMLRKIIYSGQQQKFILSSFPDIIEQAKEFERNCATIAAIFYTTT